MIENKTRESGLKYGASYICTNCECFFAANNIGEGEMIYNCPRCEGIGFTSIIYHYTSDEEWDEIFATDERIAENIWVLNKE